MRGFKLVVPLSLDDLAGAGDEPAEEFVVFDELGAGIGSRIAVSEGREAAMPFHPEVKPIDAYNAAILDTIESIGTELTVRLRRRDRTIKLRSRH